MIERQLGFDLIVLFNTGCFAIDCEDFLLCSLVILIEWA